jgi:hypothetical protein
MNEPATKKIACERRLTLENGRARCEERSSSCFFVAIASYLFSSDAEVHRKLPYPTTFYHTQTIGTQLFTPVSVDRTALRTASAFAYLSRRFRSHDEVIFRRQELDLGLIAHHEIYRSLY